MRWPLRVAEPAENLPECYEPRIRREWMKIRRGRLPAADGGGMGIRMPGGEHDPVQLRR